jgi:CheY-like chemotaxis protein
MSKYDAGEPLRVLVVEDCADSRDSLVLLLNLWGHDSVATNDGTEALRLAAEYLPKVVLLDLGLPNLNGLEVARRLRQLAAIRGVCLIATTGHADAQTTAQAQAAGCDYVLVKPFDPTELERLLCACVSETRS